MELLGESLDWMVWRVDIFDRGHWPVETSFVYRLRRQRSRAMPRRGPLPNLELIGVRVGTPPGRPVADARPLTVTEIRELPLAHWQAVARGRFFMRIVLEAIVAAGEEATISVASQLETLQPPGPSRRPDLKLVAGTYRNLVAQGIRNPAKVMAEQLEARPATVRSWIRTARQRGFLGPASGSVVGEAMAPSAPKEVRKQ